MKGFDYDQRKPVNRSIPKWREFAAEATRRGGFVREDKKLGETFIHRTLYGRTDLVAEVYGINLKLLEERRHG